MSTNNAFFYKHSDRIKSVIDSLPTLLDESGTSVEPSQVFEVVFDTNSDNVVYRVREADEPGASEMGATFCVELPGETTYQVYGAAMGAFA